MGLGLVVYRWMIQKYGYGCGGGKNKRQGASSGGQLSLWHIPSQTKTMYIETIPNIQHEVT